MADVVRLIGLLLATASGAGVGREEPRDEVPFRGSSGHLGSSTVALNTSNSNEKEFYIRHLLEHQLAQEAAIIGHLAEPQRKTLLNLLLKNCGHAQVKLGERYRHFLASASREEKEVMEGQLRQFCPKCSLNHSAMVYWQKTTLQSFISGWNLSAIPTESIAANEMSEAALLSLPEFAERADSNLTGPWLTLARYLHPVNPVSINDVDIPEDCTGGLMQDLLNHVDSWPFPRAIGGARIWAARGGSRAYPAHQHVFPEMIIMVILHGTKRLAHWPASERKLLYENPTIGKTYNKDVGDTIFMADPFHPDLDRQPLLRQARSVQGYARAGDVVVLPCSGIHLLESVTDTIAISFKWSTCPQYKGWHQPGQCGCQHRDKHSGLAGPARPLGVHLPFRYDDRSEM